MKKIKNFIFLFYIIFFSSTLNALEIIRDTELEQFTNDVLSILTQSDELQVSDLNIYFIKSNQINAFVTGGKNIFINTELLIESDDYREYAAVLAHELAHIKGGHVFNTSIEISNLSDKALPIYLLGIIGILSGAAETGVAGVMVGQASVSDNFTYYSRTQEASADQAAVKLLCKNGISADYLVSFLNKLSKIERIKFESKQNYRSTHPLTKNRIIWINSAIKNYKKCKFNNDKRLSKRFDLVKAKIHGFTHHENETEAIYQLDKDVDLYATAVSSYFKGDHHQSIKNLEKLINLDPTNPYYKELLGEIYYANGNYEKAYYYQKQAIDEIEEVNDLYLMMIGNYLVSLEENEKTLIGINYIKKSIQINPKNSYSWYLLARAYAQVDEIPLANYATAERYFLIGERELSYDFALRALENVEEKSPEWYRSFDLIEILKKEVSTNR
tara:strand:+ start:1128 stop:2459 length:1332 start_codon:yes stop_codon:yes gene_type:complete